LEDKASPSLFGDNIFHDLDYWAVEMIGNRDILKEAAETALKRFGIKADDLNNLQPYLAWKPSIPSKQTRPVNKQPSTKLTLERLKKGGTLEFSEP
jgi:hypothetical protein